jgi:hypothetical protein
VSHSLIPRSSRRPLETPRASRRRWRGFSMRLWGGTLVGERFPKRGRDDEGQCRLSSPR